ncbi:hypothetical protein Tco_0557885, partial [Tanacetum coccineum]
MLPFRCDLILGVLHENLKAQLKDNSKCVTIPDSKPKVLAPSRYSIDVEPIPPQHKNNREV